MWKYITFILACSCAFAFTGCNLDVDDDDILPGDKFWDGTPENVEAFTLSIYAAFRTATTNCAFFQNSGDLRCAPINNIKTSDKYSYLLGNDMKMFKSKTDSKEQGTSDEFGKIYNWKYMYMVIQSANILMYQLDTMSDFDSELKQAYKAEAVFIRNLAYFFLVRLFGDVPYYTEGYYAKPLPRTPMVTVLQSCLKDLQSVLDSDPNANALPWKRNGMAIRATRGAALTLMMHINMWLVRFDNTHAADYYREVKRLAEIDEWVDDETYYKLLPIEQTSSIFKGGSDEGLFEIPQNIAYGEIFKNDYMWSTNVVFECLSKTSPKYIYSKEFLRILYPRDETDKRKELWFANIIYDDITGEILPPSTIVSSGSVITIKEVEIIKMLNPDEYANKVLPNSGNYIVFRLPDAILLYAEALNKLGESDKALDELNRIRERAGAILYDTTTDLDANIYWERVRELMGEGQYFYDLVRTEKLCDANFAVFSDNTGHREKRADFLEGSWTWPIYKGALEDNPLVSKNQYWE